jgi:beta-1,4-N-acetylglucosaminyltransferase
VIGRGSKQLLAEGATVRAGEPLPNSSGMKVLLVASTGGHLTQLVALREWWSRHRRHWVTFENEHALSVLAHERVTYAFAPTTRNVPNALRNLRLAITLLRRARPDLVVSTGAGVAAPFFVVARLLGIRTLYIEVIDRIASRTLTGRMVYPLADGFAVQWPEQQALYPGATVIGATL